LDFCEKERIDFTRWFLKAGEGPLQDVEADKLNEVDELYNQYDNLTRHILLSNRTDPAIRGMLAKSSQYLAQIQSLVGEIKSLRQGMTLVSQEQISATMSRHIKFATTFLAVIVVLFAGLAFYLWRYLVRPLTLILEGIRNFTRGNTDIQIPIIGKDELGELQEAFNEMSRELNVERKKLKAESQSDSLTGLFNMRYFRKQLVEEFSRSQRYGRPMTVLMIDVDHFKAYNDRNGHPAGDIVLKEISRILIRNVRGTDMVARYGGEEFVILLPETTLDAALTVAEKIRFTVHDHHFPFRETGASEKLSVSIGVASYPNTRVTNDQDLIESADKALFLSKRNGRNQVCLFDRGEVIPASYYQKTVKSQEVA
jgi:diguanylate cyclase (GGDEF)-like protein